ncbi:MAG TPA: adenylate/guanylate cyclase domain-containing protein [Patescibacteria group bacterium]|nr:adenylate/guanylate cyclase domain-containing protein [Patescibacteria group bacterium]
MSFWTELRLPAQCEALVAFYESHWLNQYAEKVGAAEVLSVLSGYFAVTGQIIKDAGGKLIKTMGDNGLAVFPADVADNGVLALRDVQKHGEAWLAQRGTKSRVTVKMDLGPVVLGLVGSPGDEIVDVFGKPVAQAYLLPSNGFSMSPTVFRSLTPETRTLFKKHTPSIRYISVEDHHARERAGDV